jgi:hypothetical protein
VFATSSQRPFRALGVAALLAGAVTALALVWASSASADGRQCAKGWAGCGYFISKGDLFKVCDSKPDKLSVTLRWRTRKSTRNHTVTNYTGTQTNGGCKTVVRNHTEGTRVAYHVCLSKFGRPGGPKMDIIESTCSENSVDNF